MWNIRLRLPHPECTEATIEIMILDFVEETVSLGSGTPSQMPILTQKHTLPSPQSAAQLPPASGPAWNYAERILEAESARVPERNLLTT